MHDSVHFDHQDIEDMFASQPFFPRERSLLQPVRATLKDLRLSIHHIPPLGLSGGVFLEHSKFLSLYLEKYFICKI